MTHLLACGALLLALTTATAAESAATDAAATVFATSKGARYHKSGCSNAKTAMTRATAASLGLTPCKKCKP